jgi:hypothetical protein
MGHDSSSSVTHSDGGNRCSKLLQQDLEAKALFTKGLAGPLCNWAPLSIPVIIL